MNLFQLNRETYDVEIDPSVLLLDKFRVIASKHKKNKELIEKELSFIYHYCDIKSDYLCITDEVKG